MRRRLLAVLTTLAALASLTPGCAQSSESELAKLLSDLGSRHERHARFSERKFSSLLKGPIESTGVLIFRAPDILEKQTTEPRRESVRIEGNVVTYEGAASRGQAAKRTFALSEAPVLAALIESLRATLAGDLPALRRHYQVEWAALPNKQGWQLTLVPRHKALLDAVTRVVLRGAGNELSATEIVEASGDLTLMSITPFSGAVSPSKK